MKELSINDLEEFKRIVMDDSVFPWIKDDGITYKSFNPEAYFKDGVKVLQADENTIFIYVQINAITWEVHTNILPGGRGKSAVDNAEKSLIWMFCNTDCEKVISFVPSFNIRARALANKLMNVEGVLKSSFLHNSKYHDLYVFGVTKEEVV